MEVEIRALTPALLADYLHFFDDVGFTDHAQWSRCYCMFFHWRPEWENTPSELNRDRAIEYVNAGRLRGYLAYLDGEVVGWCNADDRDSFATLAGDDAYFDEATRDRRVKSIVCFLIAPAYRGKGIAKAMLERVLADAAQEGYDYIEGYPDGGEVDQFTAYRGTGSFFEKYGFEMVRPFAHGVVMRRGLRA